MPELALAIEQWNADQRAALANDRHAEPLPLPERIDLLDRVQLELDAGANLWDLRRRYGW